MQRINAFYSKIEDYAYTADFPCIDDELGAEIFDVEELNKIKTDVKKVLSLLPIPKEIYGIKIHQSIKKIGADAIEISNNKNKIFCNINPTYFPFLNNIIKNIEVPNDVKFEKGELYDKQEAIFNRNIIEYFTDALKQYEIKLNNRINFLTEDVDVSKPTKEFYLNVIHKYINDKGDIAISTLNGIDNVLCDYPNGIIDCVEGIMYDRVILVTYFADTNNVITTNDKFYKQMNIEELRIVADIIEQIKKRFFYE
jgi:hypothetical protein